MPGRESASARSPVTVGALARGQRTYELISARSPRPATARALPPGLAHRCEAASARCPPRLGNRRSSGGGEGDYRKRAAPRTAQATSSAPKPTRRLRHRPIGTAPPGNNSQRRRAEAALLATDNVGEQPTSALSVAKALRYIGVSEKCRLQRMGGRPGHEGSREYGAEREVGGCRAATLQRQPR